MKEIIDKISSYNLFNYLFPGILFVVLLKEVTYLNLIQQNIIEGIFLYYFIGLIISRLGSIIIEPFLKYLSFVKYKSYKDYLKAIEINKELKLYVEINNMFRTLCALFFLLGTIILLDWIGVKIDFTNKLVRLSIIISLLGLLLFSYRKHTKFIFKRIEAILTSSKKES